MKIEQEPLVSVGLPVYNGGNFLQEALDSILGQTYEQFELIISDNASTDDTEEICRAAAASDQRIRYFRNKQNLGAASNYNIVFQHARGPYFKWAAHDDLIKPTFLEQSVEVLASLGEEYVLVFPHSEAIDGQGQLIDHHPLNPNIQFKSKDLCLPMAKPHERLRHLLKNLGWGNPVMGLIRSASLRHTQLIGAYRAADMVLLEELALLGKFHMLQEKLFVRRLHADSSLANKSAKEVVAWYDPQQAPRRIFPKWRLFFEQLKAIKKIPNNGLEKVLCLATLLRWGVSFRVLIRELQDTYLHRSV